MGRTDSVRRGAALVAAFLIGRELAIGFRRGLILKAYEARIAAADLERRIGDMRSGRVPFRLYRDTAHFAETFNTAYGAIVREAKATGAIPQDHPEALNFRTPPIVRSNGVNGIMKRGRDGFFAWVDPKTGELPQ